MTHFCQVLCGMKGDTNPDGPELDHRIEPNVPYRLWNQATGSLLLRDPNRPGNAVSCDGSFKDMDYDSEYLKFNDLFLIARVKTIAFALFVVAPATQYFNITIA